MKKITLLMVALLLSVVGANAKTKTTTLWEGTDTGADIEVAKSALVKGATLNLTFSWVGSEGAQFSCFWWNSSTSQWVNIKNYQWVDNGKSYSFTLTDDEFDAITNEKLCFKTNDKTKLLITKIEQVETLTPTSTGDNLLNENWVVNTDNWENKNFAAQASAKIGDVILFNITVASGWKQTEVQIKDSEGNDFENNSSYIGNFENETSETFEYEINNAKDLEKIQSAGFRVNASNHATITSIKLLSYDDSYDAVSITVGSDGIATYSNGGKNVQISACDALKAYYASDVAIGTVTLTELTCIPASQGAMIMGPEGTYTVKVGGEGWENLSGKNYLRPSNDGTTVAASAGSTFHYIFAKNGSSTPAFYKLTAEHTLAAHKAYLETAEDIAPTGVRALSIIINNEPTAIINVESDETIQQKSCEDDKYYNLQGICVPNPTRGLYIRNGKKVFFK